VNTLPTSIKKALIGNDVIFILRGWPGLGRVMQGVSLSQILKKINPNQNQLFYSSERGLQFLKELNYNVNDIATGVAENLLLGGVGNNRIYSLIEAIDKRPPSAIVIDGELQLMPVLKSTYSGPVIALANAFDLFNPRHPRGKRLVFHSFYHSCDFVIVGSLSKLNKAQMPNSFPKLFWLSPLVRNEIVDRNCCFLGHNSVYDIVVVLGGGSHGAISLKSINNKIIDSVYQIASVYPKRQFTLFGDDNDDHLKAKNISYGPLSNCLNAVAKSNLVFGRPGRNLISEVLTLKKHVLLVLPLGTGKESDIHRSAEQHENANLAAKLSTGIRLWAGKSLKEFQKYIETSNVDEPVIVNWSPGNEIIEEALSC
jgi:hypothetical protein